MNGHPELSIFAITNLNKESSLICLAFQPIVEVFRIADMNPVVPFNERAISVCLRSSDPDASVLRRAGSDQVQFVTGEWIE